MEFTVVQGDIAAQRAYALVNAAGTSLRMGSGVAGALRRAGGEALNQAAMVQGPINLGTVAVTEAFDLDADYVIHAAAMPHYGDGRATTESIREAARGALAAADERGCASLVIPTIGCGVAGFPVEEGARLICATRRVRAGLAGGRPLHRLQRERVRVHLADSRRVRGVGRVTVPTS